MEKRYLFGERFKYLTSTYYIAGVAETVICGTTVSAIILPITIENGDWVTLHKVGTQTILISSNDSYINGNRKGFRWSSTESLYLIYTGSTSGWQIKVINGSFSINGNIKSISSGTTNYHGLVVDYSGSAWGWGHGDYGEIGDGTTGNWRASFCQVLGGISFSQINAGGHSSFGIKGADGTGWAWGLNTSGQLGDNTITNKASPISMVGGISFSQINCGEVHSLGINGTDGSGWAWGRNLYGEIGDNTSANSKSSPVSVLGGMSFSKISAGNSLSLGINGADGSGWAWGYNNNGQLGDNTTTNRSSPVSVLGGISFSQISAADSFSLGINGTDGSGWAWGYNGYGQLGDNSKTRRSSPVSIAGGISFSQISAGDYHGFGIRASDGSGWAWGYNGQGQLGNNTTTDQSSPISVLGGISFSQISTMYSSCFAISGLNNISWSWGQNQFRQLCDSTSTNRSSPILMVF